MYSAVIDIKSHIGLRHFMGSETTEVEKSRKRTARRSRGSEAIVADFKGASVEAVESLTEDAAAAITISRKFKPPSNLLSRQKRDQRFYFYVMCSVEPSFSKKVDEAAEDAHAEMGGGKGLAEDLNVVVIAGIRLVEVISHSSSE